MFEKSKIKKDLNRRQNQLNEVNREYYERIVEKKQLEEEIVSLKEELGILKEIKTTKDMVNKLRSEISLLEERKQLLLQEGIPKYKISDILFAIYTSKNAKDYYKDYYLGAFNFKNSAVMRGPYHIMKPYLLYQSIIGNHLIALDSRIKDVANEIDGEGFDIDVLDVISLEDLCLQINSDIMCMQEITHSEVLQIIQYLYEFFENYKKFSLMINQIKIEQKYTTNKLTLKRINK